MLVVSFAAYGVADVVAEMLAAAGRSVRIDIVLEDTERDSGTLRSMTGATDAFSSLRP